MPTVSVGRDRLFEALGQSYTQEQFEELCFDFGIELDDVTTEKAVLRKEKHLNEEAAEDEEVIYKIEVPANRYDLLCLEGLAQALRIFIGKEKVPNYKVMDIPVNSMLKMHVKPETSLIRPFIVCAVLRNITFDEARYNSFIDLQDRLHQNLCRKRTLVAIGTHDLDTLHEPFTYEALPPSQIKFIPLKQVREFRADELMEFYKSDMKLKKFLHIIESSSVFPVIYDSKRTVLSLPPIINGAHSAITLKTKNVFIECTATDLTKAKIVLNTMVTMFSIYCEKKFEVEPVEVITSDEKSFIYPDLSVWNLEVDIPYIIQSIGIPIKANEAISLLNKMQLPSISENSNILVSIPPTRSDVLHKCDIMEDVAIAYGFNNIPKTKPKSLTQGKQQCLNHVSDLIRLETARISLLPGILKTTGHNKDHPRPIKIFEVGDVVILDGERDVGAANHRHLAALYCNSNSGFEVIHGLVDRIMEVVGVPFVSVGDDSGYYIRPSHEPEFFPGRQANIIFKGKSIGAFGIVHPEVLARFDILDPCSMVEMTIEPFL
ncbi:phenylalanine--tRNA ligase beta subunit, cytoplasmic isoform X2 [Cryptomeria japonica]|uniref:phenylalanine--tRNA ligase beta subunit, cytoplasmic isoform X2 n=1 Tax=Cryptomeria japonica TaxID=3369 RepID=UPI0027DA00D6|nr:phenylalanine--tRNA ligase beta subunit, cytoplasmic isoform X2 [Cryptomeria japonica]